MMRRLTTNHIVPILAVLVILGTFTFFFCMFFMTGKISDNSVVIYILGSLNANMGMVLGYYFTASYNNRERIANTTGTMQTTTTSTQNETTGRETKE